MTSLCAAPAGVPGESFRGPLRRHPPARGHVSQRGCKYNSISAVMEKAEQRAVGYNPIIRSIFTNMPHSHRRPAALLLDCDGTVFDTESLYLEAWRSQLL